MNSSALNRSAMKKSTIFIGIALLLAVVLIWVFYPRNPQQLIIGTWKHPREDIYMEFLPGGRYKVFSPHVSVTDEGTYNFSGPRTIHFMPSDQPGRMNMIDVEVRRNTLIFWRGAQVETWQRAHGRELSSRK
ncbi:MAG: hypothetical protein M3347_13750 [Armatimonadota bacterium]|nr:hypothetical protein [Armatimonadota bacterium]